MKKPIHSSLFLALSGAVAASASFVPAWALSPTVTPDLAPTAPIEQAAAKCALKDGAYTGPVTDAYYGPLQVQANVQNGCVASIEVLQYPSDRRTSRRINDQALPILQSEVVAAQSSRVDIVSGATLTSRAYIRSLNGALSQAGGK